MSNLALGKFPLEKERWTKPEEATDGNSTRYTGSHGFASSPWPCSYTIDLGVENKIFVIRFLLWDNLGSNSTKIDARKYKFSLEISSDNLNYLAIYSNEDKLGSNGWFSFKFSNETFARYVKLKGSHNTANDEFHIIEFEIHDQEPENLQSRNIQSFDIITKIADEARIEEIIDKKILDRSQTLSGVEGKIATLENYLKKSSEALNQIDLIKNSIDFTRESIDNSERAKKWLIAAGIALSVFIVILLLFLFCDGLSSNIITSSSKDGVLKPYTTILLGAFYVTKAILLSTILFIFAWFLKNYRSEKHNYVINKHKAMSLTVATGILTRDEYKNTSRGHVFIDAMNMVFTHQGSGFSKDENNPSIAQSLFQKGMLKPED